MPNITQLFNSTYNGTVVTWGTDVANLSSPDFNLGGAAGKGFIVSVRSTKSSERIPVLDNNGVPVGIVYVPQMLEGDFEILCDANTTMPNIGDNMNISGSTYGVENVEQAWEQKGIKKLRVRGAALPS